ncbi:MAG: peptide chain release factor N(5)-glutamine methyltransferase [Deltaproteobacteria bacterium]|nr:peptide chain release factor N(5)-glutamine methyltransferase [Deltaproteobacteria bacterium]
MPTPRLEAELLLAHVLSCRRLDLYTDHDRPLDPVELSAYRKAIARRRRGEPAAYLTGVKEFWSLQIEVSADVLVPRPETEILVQACLDRISGGTLLDLGTGSGCMAVALASERDNLLVHAVDVSEPACAAARRNVERHGLSDRVTVFEGDLYCALPTGSRYETIVTNPPYVVDAEIDTLAEEVRCEPRLALAGGADGLEVIRRILDRAAEFLEPGGYLLIELDPRQAETVAHELGPAALGVGGEIICDLAGRDRVVTFELVR